MSRETDQALCQTPVEELQLNDFRVSEVSSSAPTSSEPLNEDIQIAICECLQQMVESRD